jgi:hypothetical protein
MAAENRSVMIDGRDSEPNETNSDQHSPSWAGPQLRNARTCNEF